MLNKDLILKKLEQIKSLVNELTELMAIDFTRFVADLKIIRSAERSFQLIVDLAIDINGHVILEKLQKTPDSYRQSFIELGKLQIIPAELAQSLASTASLRNILIHEYDLEEDHQKFYDAAKDSIQSYNTYSKLLYKFVEKNS